MMIYEEVKEEGLSLMIQAEVMAKSLPERFYKSSSVWVTNKMIVP
jgi:hypothetical protein